MNEPLSPLYGLVLAGGASRRMGQDKAALALHGRPQLDWACDTLARHCERVFVSIRAGQRDDPMRRGRNVILDVHDGAGPIAGIAAAQAAHPDSAWLVLACDLPFMEDGYIARLLAAREARPRGSVLTTWRLENTEFIENLVAIYEPEALPLLEDGVARGLFKLARLIPTELRHTADYTEAERNIFFNVNYPDDLQRLQEGKS